MTRDEILAAIRRAAAELGRAPSRGELRRITGVSHYRVLTEFRTLREAVRAAGLEPNPKGEKISTEDLLADWKRVAEKLGRRPLRAEYVREGKYSAGAFVGRFGSWGNISTTEDTEKHRGVKARKTKATEKTYHKEHEGRPRDNNEGPVLHNFDRVPLAAVPAPVVGMRRVTEEVAQTVVNTLLAPGNWQLAIGQTQNRGFNHKGHEGTQRKSGKQLEPCDFAHRAIQAPRGISKDRPVMGEPFDRRPMTNAPVNELGVMVLFGMVAAGLGLQVESVQGKFPDCIARRQVAPGKWQYLRIEFEYESKNFKLHGHDPKGCDVIVCWRHNWKECPAEIEVVELCRLVGSN
ncbi:MAG TPA: hypothetical protein VHQ22_19720 [Terriglobales bacterium]|jgi:hypothetical protein|nr:hypothetical protein [Terriglobales bacterium]